MDVSHSDLAVAFGAQGEIVSDLVKGIPDGGAATRLPGWSSAVLIGHVATGVETLWRWRGEPSDTELDAVTYWDAAGAVAAPSSEWAIRYAGERTHRSLVDGYERSFEHARTVVANTQPGAVIRPPLGSAWLRFDQFLATRVLELTVHSFDLAHTIDVEPAANVEALGITSAILDARLEGERPGDLHGPIAWIEAGTGRVPHEDPRLPLVS